MLQTKCEEDLKLRQQLEEQVGKYSSEIEDLKLKLSEEMDRVAFLERENTCHAEVGCHVLCWLIIPVNLVPGFCSNLINSLSKCCARLTSKFSLIVILIFTQHFICLCSFL